MCDDNDDMTQIAELQRRRDELQNRIDRISFDHDEPKHRFGLREKSFVYYTLQKRIEELENEIRELKKEN